MFAISFKYKSKTPRDNSAPGTANYEECAMRTVCAVGVLLAIWTAAADGQTTQAVDQKSFVIGRLDHPPLRESSGIVASRRFAGVYWTHNDSGNPAVVFAVNREGKLLAELPIVGRNPDWEDIAIDADGHLYIADIGNNGGRRRQVQVLQFAEPDPADPPDAPLKPMRIWQLTYPGKPFDAEAFFVHDGHGYVISKFVQDAPLAIYRFPLTGDADTHELEHIADLPNGIPVTAADLSADGQWLLVLTVAGPHVYQVRGDLKSVASAPAYSVWYFDLNMEAGCFVDEGVLATSESRDVLLFTWDQLAVPRQNPPENQAD